MIRRWLVAVATYIYRRYGVTEALLSDELTGVRARADAAEQALATQAEALRRETQAEVAALTASLEARASMVDALRFKLTVLNQVRELIIAAQPIIADLEAIKDPTSSEWKHATAFGRLVKRYPAANRRDIGLAIELALRGF